jgi:hypothetical protein
MRYLACFSAVLWGNNMAFSDPSMRIWPVEKLTLIL